MDKPTDTTNTATAQALTTPSGSIRDEFRRQIGIEQYPEAFRPLFDTHAEYIEWLESKVISASANDVYLWLKDVPFGRWSDLSQRMVRRDHREVLMEIAEKIHSFYLSNSPVLASEERGS